jgi:hypothetical protein
MRTLFRNLRAETPFAGQKIVLAGVRASECASALAELRGPPHHSGECAISLRNRHLPLHHIESSTKLLDELGVDDYAKALRD